MGYTCFDVEIADKIAHVRMNRPEKLNSMIPEFWRELPEIVTDISDTGNARVIVISSTGKHFCAGMDLSVFAGIGAQASPDPGRRNASFSLLVRQLQASFTVLEQARVPVLVAIQGGCIGGALDMVCAADMRFATEDAFFVVEETRIGMTADVGTLQRLPKLIPDGVAREMVYTGRRLPAGRAREVGLVNEVFPDQDAMLTSVMDTAATIAGHSPLAVWGAKEALVYSRDHSVPDGLHQISLWQSGAFQPEDMVEGFAAKAEKRTPDFPDLPPSPKQL